MKPKSPDWSFYAASANIIMHISRSKNYCDLTVGIINSVKLGA